MSLIALPAPAAVRLRTIHLRTIRLERLAVPGALLPLLLLVTLVSRAYHLFSYPNYTGDEGIYMEQAWAVLRGRGLAPYTYFYDHAPAGWIAIAAWLRLLPEGTAQWGMAINSGRVLMLLVSLASTALLYRVALRLSGSHAAGLLAGTVFALSPLSLYYGRMVLLDNLMIFWLLLSLEMLTGADSLFALLGSGTAFALAVLTKENAIYFAPVIGVLVVAQCRGRHFYPFGVLGWLYICAASISLYPLFALLKGELIGDQTFLISAHGGHVSLMGALEWQLFRSEGHGSIFSFPHGKFWDQVFGSWASKDPLILIAGSGATLFNIVVGLCVAPLRRSCLLAGALAIAFATYLVRGAVLLEFYILPLLPFLALNIGIAGSVLYRWVPARALAPLLVVLASAAALFFLGVEQTGRDLLRREQTGLESAQLAFIRAHLPSDATLMISDDLWVDLRDGAGGSRVAFPRADSHFKIGGDPEIRDAARGIDRDWRRIDYVVASYGLFDDLRRGTADPYHVALDAYRHSIPIWSAHAGEVDVSVRKVVRWSEGSSLSFAGTAEGASGQLVLTVLNPALQSAQVALTLVAPTGTRREAVVLAPAGVLTLPLARLGLRSGAFALRVAATGRVAAELVLRGVAPGTAAIAPSVFRNRWYLADSYAGLTFRESLAIINPDPARAAAVRLLSYGADGLPPSVHQLTVPPGHPAGVAINQILSRGSRGIVVVADRPVALTRTMVFGANGEGVGVAVGQENTSTTWRFASGGPHAVESFLAILNPGAAPARLSVHLAGRDAGSRRVMQVRVPGRTRATISLGSAMRDPGARITLISDAPIVAEIAAYSGSPNAVGVFSAGAAAAP